MTILVSVAALAGAASGQAADPLERRNRIIRANPGEYKWREIPWLLDLDEGIRLARKERRPILLWVSGDDPLERC